jgi:hypothetical protein
MAQAVELEIHQKLEYLERLDRALREEALLTLAKHINVVAEEDPLLLELLELAATE